jgi:hypothetical protein
MDTNSLPQADQNLDEACRGFLRSDKNDGRPVGTRTPDLYRVNLS